jgi:hypothetical protein
MISPAQDLSSMFSFSVRHKRNWRISSETTLAYTGIEIRQLLDKCKDQEGERFAQAFAQANVT